MSTIRMKAVHPAQQDDGETNVATDVSAYHDIARIVERMHRRFLDLVRLELERRGADDLSPVQALMVLLIGDDELSVRDLMERGYFLGSNASYNLKNLVETGYVDRAASQRDRRSARLRLSDKGRTLCQELRRVEISQVETLVRSAEDVEDLATTYRMLRRLERLWTDLIRYSNRGYD
jgi:DNA-binding MarR family transcriptional regulator